MPDEKSRQSSGVGVVTLIATFVFSVILVATYQNEKKLFESKMTTQEIVQCPPNCGNVTYEGSSTSGAGEPETATKGESGTHTNRTRDQYQIHLSLGEVVDAPSLYVTWSTKSSSNKSECVQIRESKSSKSLPRSYCSDHLTNGKAQHDYIHVVHIPHLEPEIDYNYSVGNDGNYAAPRQVHVYKKDHFNLPIAIFGDLGAKHAVSLDSLRKDVAEGRYHCVIHAGDLAYNLDKVGDDFMNEIEPIAAMVPYHVIPGNHDAGSSLKHFRERFAMPTQGRTNSHKWHSFDFGAIHFTMISTEVWKDKHAEKKELLDEQYDWIESDLRNASARRHEIPFLVVVGHRPVYCSYKKKELKSLRKGNYGLDSLLFKYKVDIYFAGHLHAYERTFPLYNESYEEQEFHRYINPNKTVHVTIGNAGNRENIKKITEVDPWSVAHINSYGYGRLTAVSKNELLWEHVDAKTRNVTDYVRIEKA